jgi:hypothetical protein
MILWKTDRAVKQRLNGLDEMAVLGEVLTDRRVRPALQWNFAETAGAGCGVLQGSSVSNVDACLLVGPAGENGTTDVRHGLPDAAGEGDSDIVETVREDAVADPAATASIAETARGLGRVLRDSCWTIAVRHFSGAPAAQPAAESIDR